MDLGLRNRACIVTGASSGIGAASARALAAEGAGVLLIGRRQEALALVAQTCVQAATDGVGEARTRIRTLALDLVRPTSGHQAVSACIDGFGKVDVLVNNAGASERRSLAGLSGEDWQAQWEINVMAPMRLMRAAAPHMAGQGWGRIVNVCSSSGKRPSSTNMAYSVTKAAELSLSRAFADLYAADGVLVNAIAPGPIAGQRWLAPGGLADQFAAADGTTREAVLASVAARVPLRRLGTNEEIADVIVFLCSERVANVAGAAWSVDGGSVPVII